MSHSSKVTANLDFKTLFIFIGFLLLATYVFWQIIELGWLDIIKNQEQMRIIIKEFGLFGPLAIIFLMAIAIVFSPLPSAPIALISGALYGHTFGTFYVIIGSLLGAITAFFIAKILGRDFVIKKMGDHLPRSIIGSQNIMTAIVFVSRLLPFISFDIISYAAGLTNLTTLRFIIATLAGIIPMSFILAHLGSEMQLGDNVAVSLTILLLGLLILIPILINIYNKRDKNT